MSVTRKKQEEKTVKILRELLSSEGNRHCFECGQRGPTYVNVTVGAFVCTSCSGALRKYSHRLKSISMSNFSQTEMDFIKKRGNNICKKIYYGLCENNVPPEMDIKNGMLDSHLRAKYETKKWFVEPAADLEEEALAQNQVIFDRVEKGVPKPVRSYTINSSSNIIIEPPKQSGTKLASSKESRASIDLGENLPSYNSKTQHKSSNDITNTIDPAKLSGGSAVKLPMPSDNKSSAWLSNSDMKADHNTQSPFGDDFLFPTTSDKSITFTPISKSQTMNFSMPPLVPMSQGGVSAAQGPQNHGEFKNSDKYAALAELDDLFSSSSISKQPPVTTAFSPVWDSGTPYTTWYGGNVPYSATTVATSNPFSVVPSIQQGAPAFNPFTIAGHDHMQPLNHHQPTTLNWTGAPALGPSNGNANPFLNAGAPVVNSSKNPFL